jgi:putative uncharacterized protein FNV0124
VPQYYKIFLWHKKRGEKMNAKIGRPTIGNPKTIEVKARIDEETNEKLKEFCRKNNLTRTDVVRMGIEKVLNEK